MRQATTASTGLVFAADGDRGLSGTRQPASHAHPPPPPSPAGRSTWRGSGPAHRAGKGSLKCLTAWSSLLSLRLCLAGTVLCYTDISQPDSQPHHPPLPSLAARSTWRGRGPAHGQPIGSPGECGLSRDLARP